MAKERVHIIRYRRERAVALAPSMLVLSCMFGGFFVLSPPTLLYSVLVCGLALMLAGGWGRSRIESLWRREGMPGVEATLEVRGDSLRFEGADLEPVEIARHDIRSAAVTRTGRISMVELTRRGLFRGRILVQVADEEEGHALVDRMALGAGQVASHHWTAAPFHGRRTWVIVLLTALMMFAFLSVGPPWLVFLAVPIMMTAFGVQVTVGADGVRTRWFGRERFVAHGEIRAIDSQTRPGGRFVRLHLHDGEIFEIPEALRYGATAQSRAVLLSSIREAHAHHQADEVPSVEALIGRQPGVGITDWIQRLRALDSLGQHRSAAVVEEPLWRIVESSSAPPLTRAAAAIALGPQRDGATRARFEAATESIASEKLRIVLSAAADDTEVLEEALAELEEEQRVAVAR